MNRARVRDPDIAALEHQGGGLTEARSLVVRRARELSNQYAMFEAGEVTRRQRLLHIAEMVGYEVCAMELNGNAGRDREAVIVTFSHNRSYKGKILYDPSFPDGRILFSIAHEIAHTFFPNTNGGIKFRQKSLDGTSEITELERLCDAGAAELLMPMEEFRSAVADWTASSVVQLSKLFGASLEATFYRLASAYPGNAAAGLVRYRRCKSDEAKLAAATNGDTLFPLHLEGELPSPKYRRQSFVASESLPKAATIPWNKSFDIGSAVYTPGTLTKPSVALETLPCTSRANGVLECVTAPYQRPGSSTDAPDVLFFWRQSK